MIAKIMVSVTGRDETGSKRRRIRKCFKINTEKSKMLSIITEKCLNFKFLFTVILLATIYTFFNFPAAFNPSNHLLYNSSSRFVDVNWIWRRVSTNDPSYESHLEIDWNEISKALSKLNRRKERLSIALLNFNGTETEQWKRFIPHAKISVVHLEPVDDSITWNTLYPEWIDEEQESETPTCPRLPDPVIQIGTIFDLVAVKLPSPGTKNWSRDITRLHLQLTAAKIAAGFGRRGDHYAANVLILTDFFPIPNIFLCNEIVHKGRNVWLYRPELDNLRRKLQLPVGSCELALPLNAEAENNEVKAGSNSGKREAYVTILHSADEYVCGAIVAAQSIRMAGSTRDLVILVDDSISDRNRRGLQSAGWKVRTVDRIRNPKAQRDAYNEWNYSKFRLWQLTDYSKLVFIDADLLIFRNIDDLFSLPEISATGNNATLFNSGVMVVEPSNCTFSLLMEYINEIESYNGGDQGYLNEIFTWWHRVPKHMNFLKNFWIGDDDAVKAKKTKLFTADPPVLYVLHYLGLKPWLCYRDYDCNWDVEDQREFASDEAHEKWWKVHDAMPEKLQEYCLLDSRRKAGIEWNRRQAAKANFSDGHWKWKIRDKRMDICIGEYCDWKDMLKHWGETNWTDPAAAVDGVVAVPEKNRAT